MPEVRKIPSYRHSHKPFVAAYVRVSTEKNGQEESLENQAAYYEQKIQSNPEWEFAGIYSDTASGTHAENRGGFQQLIEDGLAQKVDIILVKSISRWSRNMVDGLNAIKLLTGNGVVIIFEQEGIDTRTPGVILPMNLGQHFAEMESRSISENLKWVYRNRAKQGKFIAQRGKYFGYNTDDGKFTPDANAEHVRWMYEQYIAGKSTKQIAEELTARGIRTLKDTEFSKDSVRGILTNEVYVGDVRIYKTPSRDVITGFIDKAWEEHYVREHHEGIVERSLWEEAQKIATANKTKIQSGEEKRTLILKQIKADPGTSAARIAENIHMQEDAVKYHLRQLRKQGRVKRAGSKKPGYGLCWAERMNEIIYCESARSDTLFG